MNVIVTKSLAISGAEKVALDTSFSQVQSLSAVYDTNLSYLSNMQIKCILICSFFKSLLGIFMIILTDVTFKATKIKHKHNHKTRSVASSNSLENIVLKHINSKSSMPHYRVLSKSQIDFKKEHNM